MQRRSGVLSLVAGWVVLFSLMGCSGKTLDPGVPAAQENPGEVENLSWWSRAAMDAYLRQDVWRGNRAGYVLMFARDGVPIHANAYGWADIASERPMMLTTPMRFASMTKPVIAVAAMQLVEQGRMDLDDPVAKYIPAFADSQVAVSQARNAQGDFDTRPAQPVLVRHLLMFASGIGPGRDEETELWQHWQANSPREEGAGTLQERISAMASLPLFEEPGTRWRYGWSADALAAVVEVVSGQRIDAYLQANVFEPLGMGHTRYLVNMADRSGLATVYRHDASGELIDFGSTIDADFPEGGSGLVSTAGDYLRFALMLWNDGTYQGVQVLQPDTLAQIQALHVPGGVMAHEGIEGIGWGLGFAVVADDEASVTPDRTGDFWWAGYFGTHFFVSPETGLVGVLLSQTEPSPGNEVPFALYVAQAIAFAGL
ncbi:serine hydrolase [Halioglobus sp. HI00S01]|uniref:serine hydrolase domain-containing protein n=1 Tax=Halioglobus sp. HI00S01 TaxID=1822214 RepID=UPI0009EF3914|nr:serine hydrolase domain-containing protein [Halioglobus sp. HI00S01]